MAKEKKKSTAGVKRKVEETVWLESHDRALRDMVLRLGSSNAWDEVVVHPPLATAGHSPEQCKARWHVIRDLPVRGNWTEDEDNHLASLVARLGSKMWSQIALDFPGRSGKQCRERWLNHIDGSIAKVPWTHAEDRLLAEAHKMVGSSWCIISKLLPGRGETAVKNRFHSGNRCKVPLDRDGKAALAAAIEAVIAGPDPDARPASNRKRSQRTTVLARRQEQNEPLSSSAEEESAAAAEEAAALAQRRNSRRQSERGGDRSSRSGTVVPSAASGCDDAGSQEDTDGGENGSGGPSMAAAAAAAVAGNAGTAGSGAPNCIPGDGGTVGQRNRIWAAMAEKLGLENAPPAAAAAAAALAFAAATAGSGGRRQMKKATKRKAPRRRRYFGIDSSSSSEQEEEKQEESGEEESGESLYERSYAYGNIYGNRNGDAAKRVRYRSSPSPSDAAAAAADLEAVAAAGAAASDVEDAPAPQHRQRRSAGADRHFGWRVANMRHRLRLPARRPLLRTLADGGGNGSGGGSIMLPTPASPPMALYVPGAASAGGTGGATGAVDAAAVILALRSRLQRGWDASPLPVERPAAELIELLWGESDNSGSGGGGNGDGGGGCGEVRASKPLDKLRRSHLLDRIRIVLSVLDAGGAPLGAPMAPGTVDDRVELIQLVDCCNAAVDAAARSRFDVLLAQRAVTSASRAMVGSSAGGDGGDGGSGGNGGINGVDDCSEGIDGGDEEAVAAVGEAGRGSGDIAGVGADKSGGTGGKNSSGRSSGNSNSESAAARDAVVDLRLRPLMNEREALLNEAEGLRRRIADESAGETPVAPTGPAGRPRRKAAAGVTAAAAAAAGVEEEKAGPSQEKLRRMQARIVTISRRLDEISQELLLHGGASPGAAEVRPPPAEPNEAASSTMAAALVASVAAAAPTAGPRPALLVDEGNKAECAVAAPVPSVALAVAALALAATGGNDDAAPASAAAPATPSANSNDATAAVAARMAATVTAAPAAAPTVDDRSEAALARLQGALQQWASVRRLLWTPGAPLISKARTAPVPSPPNVVVFAPAAGPSNVLETMLREARVATAASVPAASATTAMKRARTAAGKAAASKSAAAWKGGEAIVVSVAEAGALDSAVLCCLEQTHSRGLLAAMGSMAHQDAAPPAAGTNKECVTAIEKLAAEVLARIKATVPALAATALPALAATALPAPAPAGSAIVAAPAAAGVTSAGVASQAQLLSLVTRNDETPELMEMEPTPEEATRVEPTASSAHVADPVAAPIVASPPSLLLPQPPLPPSFHVPSAAWEGGMASARVAAAAVDAVIAGRVRTAVAMAVASGNTTGATAETSAGFAFLTDTGAASGGKPRDGSDASGDGDSVGVNAAALAALFAHHHRDAGRVAVIDLTTRHGAGTQDILCRTFSPAFLFCSVHAFGPAAGDGGGSGGDPGGGIVRTENEPKGAGSVDGAAMQMVAGSGLPSKKGKGKGKGRARSKQKWWNNLQSGALVGGRGSGGPSDKPHPHVVNLPLPWPLTGSAVLTSADRMAAAIERFRPDLIVVTVDFSARRGHPSGLGALVAADYAALAGRVKTLAERCCGGRLVAVIDGGWGGDDDDGGGETRVMPMLSPASPLLPLVSGETPAMSSTAVAVAASVAATVAGAAAAAAEKCDAGGDVFRADCLQGFLARLAGTSGDGTDGQTRV